MKVYHRGQVVKVHPRQRHCRGAGRRTRPDFPPGTDVYARRDVDRLAKNWPGARGEAIGAYAARILDTDLPWTKMRAVYALIGLCRTYGNGPVEQACAAALELDVVSVPKIRSIVEKGTGAQGRASRRPRPPGGCRGGAGHRGAVRPRSPRVRHRDQGSCCGVPCPAAGSRGTRLTIRRVSLSPGAFRFVSFVSFHSAGAPGAGGRRTRSHDLITAQA